MKIALEVALPDPWARETDPQGNIVYYNSNTEELTHHHPMEIFFRKAFNRVISWY